MDYKIDKANARTKGARVKPMLAKLASSLMGLENWQERVDILEKKRPIVTGFVQKLLDNGWSVKLALTHLAEFQIPKEDLKLIRGEDLRLPEAEIGLNS